jgi:hypothetical protein
MNCSSFRPFIIAAASAVVAVMPTAPAGAQSLSTPLLSPEQVRAEYVDRGFQASRPITWWTDGSTTFTIEDPTELNSPSGRVLMVIVFPDLASAEAARQADDRLVMGYGPSVFQGNVALVQTTRGDIMRRYAAEVNRSDPSYAGTDTSPEAITEPSYPVGLDFLAVLRSDTTNL